jgi:hypothetical protein
MQQARRSPFQVAVVRAVRGIRAEAQHAVGTTGPERVARLEHLSRGVDWLRSLLELPDDRAFIAVQATLTRLRWVLRQGLGGLA